MTGFQASLTDINGAQWALTDDAPGQTGAWLMGPPGLKTPVTVTSRATTTQIGATPSGWSGDPMEGTLKVKLWNEGDGLLRRWLELQAGFSTFEDAELLMRTPGFGDATALLRLNGDFPDPEVSPASHNLQELDIEIPVKAWAGCWFADQTVATDTLTWTNDGDLPARGLVTWTGVGATIRLRDAAGSFDTGPITLPATPVPAVLELDPGVASRVTINGEDAPDLWRAMRARIFPEIHPHMTVLVDLTGDAEIDLTARLTKPWRWHL